MADLWLTFSGAERAAVLVAGIALLIVLAGWALAQLADPFVEDALEQRGDE